METNTIITVCDCGFTASIKMPVSYKPDPVYCPLCGNSIYSKKPHIKKLINALKLSDIDEATKILNKESKTLLRELEEMYQE